MKYIVDLSDWQEQVDWQGLLNKGYSGSIIKLGEKDYIADTLTEKIHQAIAYGFEVGVYYYSHAENQDDAVQEAEFVNDAILEKNIADDLTLGIWYDYEEYSAMIRAMNSKIECSDVINSFVNRLLELGYKNVGVYSAYRYFAMYTEPNDLSENGETVIPIDTEKLDGVPIWVAQYNYRDDLSLEYPDLNIRMWQFTDRISEELPYDGSVMYEV